MRSRGREGVPLARRATESDEKPARWGGRPRPRRAMDSAAGLQVRSASWFFNRVPMARRATKSDEKPPRSRGGCFGGTCFSLSNGTRPTNWFFKGGGAFASLIAQRLHGIDASGAARGQVACDERHKRQHQGHRDEARAVGG